MLTRLYIDNFRCFVNFEYRPRRTELIIGRNGCGKSSMMDALLCLRQFITRGDEFDAVAPMMAMRTRWQKQTQQTFEIEATLDQRRYTYKLVLEPIGDAQKSRAVSETVEYDGKLIFAFEGGEVRLFNDQSQHKVTYGFDWHRSALASIMPRKDNTILTLFKRWMAGIYCFRLNPFAMLNRAESEESAPRVELANFAAWYRFLIQSNPRQNADFMESLRESLDGFQYLQLDAAGENVRVLSSEFASPIAGVSKYYFQELSDGQRCLICLYAIVHFLLAQGASVFLDEPDNFISLREIQPWLVTAEEVAEQGGGQLILISHHPESINRLAGNNGTNMYRESNGTVRVGPFEGDPGSVLPPAELIARGWERG